MEWTHFEAVWADPCYRNWNGIFDKHKVNSSQGSAGRPKAVVSRAGFMTLKFGSKVVVGSVKRID